MYLVTTTNIQDPDYFIVLANKTKKQCLAKRVKMRKEARIAKKNINTVGDREVIEIDLARAANAKVLTEEQAIKLFGSEDDLKEAVDYMF